MILLRVLLLNALLAIMLAGCKPEQPAPPPASSSPPASAEPAIPTKAQPKLPTIKLYIGPKEVEAEIAITDEQLQTGMMFRQEMAEDSGMLFVFPIPHRASFWMKNCDLPLAVAYIDPTSVIEEIHEMQAHNTNSVRASTDNVQFVLEMNKGWFQKNGIQPGAAIRTPRGTLKETFPPETLRR